MALFDNTDYAGSSGYFVVGTTGVVSPAIKLSDSTNSTTIFNSGRLNTDFRILPTGNQIGLFFDASSSRLGINTLDPTAALHIKDVCADGGMKIESTDNCTDGVALNLLHSPTAGSKSGDFPSTINLIGKNNNNNQDVIYAQIRSQILDPVTSKTSGAIIFYVDKTGVLYQAFYASTARNILGINNLIRDGLYETVLGSNNKTQYADNATIVGSNNLANDFANGLLIGRNNTLSGTNIIGIINFGNISGHSNTVYGAYNSITGTTNIGFGTTGNISGSNNIFIGNQISIMGLSDILLGSNSTISGTNNIVVGIGCLTSGHNNLYYGNNGIIDKSNDILSFGNNQDVVSTNSGIFIGNNISISSGSTQTTVIGLNNNYNKLVESLLFGHNNSIDGISSGLILFGQANKFSAASSGSVILGQFNNVSGYLNNIFIGQTNNNTNTSNNNIVVGFLNNRTGVVARSTGVFNYGYENTNSINNNTIILGVNNNIENSNNSIVIGNKNTNNNNNNIVVGSFNLGSGTNNIQGNSNVCMGANNIVVGSRANIFGNNIVKVGNSGSIYGDRSLCLGYNRLLASGSAIGHSNIIHNINNVVYGNNNSIGYPSIYNFTIDNNKIIIAIPPGNLSDIEDTDTLGLYLYNKNVSPAYLEYEVVGKQEYGSNSTSFDLAISQTDLFNVTYTFDEQNTTPTVISGVLVKIASTGNNIFYGKNNLVVGNNNNILQTGCVILGNNISTTGSNVTIIGDNISYSGNDACVIGSKDNKIILSDNSIFNVERSQNSISVLSTSDSSTVQYTDLVNKKIGINKNNPNATLDVDGDASFASIVLTENANSGYVLTSDSAGSGSWQKPVSVVGQTNGLLIGLSDTVVSGIETTSFIPSTTGLNLYDSTIILSPTGTIFRNSPLLFNDVNDEIAFGVYPTNSKTIVSNLHATNATITGAVILPSGSLSGGLLYVEENGALTSNRLSVPYCLNFNNSNNNPDGDSRLRYFPTGDVLGLGKDTHNTVGFDSSNFNIILSANPNIDTIFNKSKLTNHNFGILSTTDAPGYGLYYSNSGVLSINSNAPEPYVNDADDPDNEIRVKVYGKLYAQKIRCGAGQGQSGLYLRAIDNDGNLALQPLSIPINQTATYPITTVYNANSDYKVALTTYKSWNSSNQLQGGNNIDGGKTLIWNGGSLAEERWVVGSNFRARQGGCGSCYRGIEFGDRTSLLQNNDSMGYSAGTFKTLTPPAYYDRYNGAAQVVWYHLRTATSGVENNEMIMNFPSTLVASSNNTISFNNTILDSVNSETSKRDFIWQYDISVNIIWQSGNNSSSIDAASFVYKGAVKKIGNNSITQIGTPTTTSYLPVGSQPVVGIIVRPYESDNIPRLQILASGGSPDYHIKWSAVAQINQINLPSGAFSFQY